MKLTHFCLISIFVFAALAMSACVPVAQSDNSEASFGLIKGERIPTAESVYVVTGEVIADVESMVRQVRPARGSVSSVNGSSYGYYVGPTIDGKSFIRIVVADINPRPTDINAYAESGIIFKFTDTKATALLPGDIIEFKCRRQYESVAPVRDNEPFDIEKFSTWEFDFCRMTTGIITQKGK